MLVVRSQHIGNHATWGKRREQFIEQMLADPKAAKSAEPGLYTALANLREVQPMHGPLLIEDMCITAGADAPRFTRATAV